MLSFGSLFAVCDPINDPASCIGATGATGKDGANAWAYENLEAGLAAVSSVELNPDHKGFSMGFGVAKTAMSKAGGAIGLMWGFDLKESKGFDSALHVKAYKATGDTSGVSAGITLGF